MKKKLKPNDTFWTVNQIENKFFEKNFKTGKMVSIKYNIVINIQNMYKVLKA